MRNYLIIGGKDSRDFGVYISGQGTFSAPEKAYEFYNVPGRSGAILGNDHRLENIEVSYQCFIYNDFSTNIADFRTYLLSLNGYQRLTDSYHPDEYRMAVYVGPFEPEVTSMNNAGSFELVFNCKPQRYLLSGETIYSFVQGAEIELQGNEVLWAYGPKIDTSYLFESIDNNASGVPLEFGFYINGELAYLGNRPDDSALGYSPVAVDYDYITGTANVYKKWGAIPITGWSLYQSNPEIFRCSLPGATVLETEKYDFVKGKTVSDWISDVAIEYSYSSLFSGGYLYLYDVDCSTVSDIQSAVVGSRMLVNQTTPDTFSITPYVPEYPHDYFSIKAYYTPKYMTDIIKIKYTGVSDEMSNPSSFPSSPLIRIFGTGSFEMDGVTVTITTCNTYTDVDCETMDCYEGSINRNSSVSFSTYDFPKLQPGDNTVTVSAGITLVQITPRWWQV